MAKKAPIVLLILDGWGHREESNYNAIVQAKTPQWDKWQQQYPPAMLDASGYAVGLPDAQMGNSEVGHMHIGAGRRIPQDFTRINEAIAQGEFSENLALVNAIQQMKRSAKTFHVMGLLSPGGVHSHENHLFAFLSLCAQYNFTNVCLHLFLDGRDTPPQSAMDSLKRLQAVLLKYPVAKIGSISGRYYAMDRDQRWERIEPVYRLLADNESPCAFEDPKEALESFYQQTIFDEFIPPTKIGEGQAIESGDAIFFFNFRSDRARQLTQVFLDKNFSEFTKTELNLAAFISMTRYSQNLPTEIVFPPLHLNNTLGEVLATNGLSQLRIAETEKYAHVTFFLNGGTEGIYEGEDRILIQSPKVATYDLQPEMNAYALTDAIIEAIESQRYDVIICNYANADMVGHSGNFTATVKAIECLDQCMQKIWQALDKKSGKLLITSDHGNAELMFDETTQQVQTAHTSLPVPFLFIGKGWRFSEKIGSLIDLAPTLLTLLDIKPPEEMTGKSLLVKEHAS